MEVTWTSTQRQRLIELGADTLDLERKFCSKNVREDSFHKLASELVGKNKARLDEYRSLSRKPALLKLQGELAAALVEEGFVQVNTPIILARGLLAKMSIDEKHPLFHKVFWLDNGKCLRPMLAPNLYFILKDLLRLWPKPVRIFEIGPCFRKESEGAHHLNEFTMLNLVEMGLPAETCSSRLEDLANLVMMKAGITGYRLEKADSEVYGETVDVTAGFELGSGATGPHPLDRAWGIYEPWAGIGFGLERLLMAKRNSSHIKREGKSLTYLDGARLNI